MLFIYPYSSRLTATGAEQSCYTLGANEVVLQDRIIANWHQNTKKREARAYYVGSTVVNSLDY